MTVGDIVFAVMAILLMWVSYRFGMFRGRRTDKSSPVAPMCPCTHIWGAHKEGGPCVAQIERPHYNKGGSRNGHEWVPCPCTKYHGPVMINASDIIFDPGHIIQG